MCFKSSIHPSVHPSFRPSFRPFIHHVACDWTRTHNWTKANVTKDLMETSLYMTLDFLLVYLVLLLEIIISIKMHHLSLISLNLLSKVYFNVLFELKFYKLWGLWGLLLVCVNYLYAKVYSDFENAWHQYHPVVYKN